MRGLRHAARPASVLVSRRTRRISLSIPWRVILCPLQLPGNARCNVCFKYLFILMRVELLMEVYLLLKSQ